MLDGVQDVKHAREGRLHLNQAAGQHRDGSRARRGTTRTVTAPGAAAFDQDGRQHAKAIAEGVQVARPVDPGMLETWDFGNAEIFFRHPHMDQRLDLEAVAPQQPFAPG